MNLRKVIFVFGGGGLIILILAYRFGLIAKLEKTVRPVWDKQVKVRLAGKGAGSAAPKPAAVEKPAAPAKKPAAAAAKPTVPSGPFAGMNKDQLLEMAQTMAGISDDELSSRISKATKDIASSDDFQKVLNRAEAVTRRDSGKFRGRRDGEAPKATSEEENTEEKAVEEEEDVQENARPAFRKPPVRKSVRARKEKLDPLGLGDPFAYAANGAGNYTPLAGGKTVGAIQVKGIIRLQDQEPVAILSLKESERVYYVRRGDVIRVNTAGKKGAVRSEAYIVVQDVRNEEVELIQQERPDKVIIIR